MKDLQQQEFSQMKPGDIYSARFKNKQIDAINQLHSGVNPPTQIIPDTRGTSTNGSNTGLWAVVRADNFGSPYQTLYNITTDLCLNLNKTRPLGQYPQTDREIKDFFLINVISVGGNKNTILVLAKKVVDTRLREIEKVVYIFEVKENGIRVKSIPLRDDFALIADDTIVSIDGNENVIILCSQNRILHLDINKPTQGTFEETIILPKVASDRIHDMVAIAGDNTFTWVLTFKDNLMTIRKLNPLTGDQLLAIIVNIKDVINMDQRFPTIRPIDIAGTNDTCYVAFSLFFPDIVPTPESPQLTREFHYIFTYTFVSNVFTNTARRIFSPDTSQIVGFGGKT